MEKERNVDRLAGYLIKLGGLAIIAALCWYFKTVLVYIAIAFVVSLIGRPIMKLLRKITIKKKHGVRLLLPIFARILIVVLHPRILVYILWEMPAPDVTTCPDSAEVTKNYQVIIAC